MKQSRDTLRLNIMTLVVLLCSGCASPAVYYKPSGPGVLVSSEQDAVNLMDELKIPVADGVMMKIRSKPTGRSTSFFIQLMVRKDKWVQFTNDTLVLMDRDGNMRTALIGPIDMAAIPGGDQTKTLLVTDRLEGNFVEAKGFQWTTFVIEVSVDQFRPASFKLQFPALTVSDLSVSIAPVSFKLQRGVRFYKGLAS